MLGGAASMRLAMSPIVASTAASTGSFTRTTGATPARCTVRFACTVPRASASAALARATAPRPRPSRAAARSRSSSPLALTDFSSQAHA